MGKNIESVSALEALEFLKAGNIRYLSATANGAAVSPWLRELTASEGQEPYAAIISCADSRVIPESIFSAGIGDLFVMRNAGNVVSDQLLGSLEYAVESLGVRLAVVLGHTGCGAVSAAMKDADGRKYISYVTKAVRAAIGDETDAYKACVLNVKNTVASIKRAFEINDDDDDCVVIIGAIYNIESGKVEFFDGGSKHEYYDN